MQKEVSWYHPPLWTDRVGWQTLS